MEKVKVFCSKIDILRLPDYVKPPKMAIIFPKSEKYFSKTIDKAGRWVYNDTVILKTNFSEVYDGNCEKEEY